MPLCGFNKRMIDGIVTFSDGLFTATLDRGKQNGVDDLSAVATEVREIGLFIDALKERYGSPDDSGKAMPDMIYGIAVFAGGLLKSTLARQRDTDADLAAVFDAQVKEVGGFLEALEKKHQTLKRTNSPEATMKKAVEWIDANSALSSVTTTIE
jgi:hypothetical protein